jgi:osmotically-inducible protein OsmY
MKRIFLIVVVLLSTAVAYAMDNNTDTSSAVASTEAISDRALETHIRQVLMSESQFSSQVANISINVADGHVTLKGAVDTEEDRQEIISKIEKIAGVSSIDNQLQISRK